MKLYPTSIRFVRVQGQARLDIRLEFSGPEKRTPMSFEVSFADAMRLLAALMYLRVKYNIPTPPNVRLVGRPVEVKLEPKPPPDDDE